jgi:hypothetical protein
MDLLEVKSIPDVTLSTPPEIAIVFVAEPSPRFADDATDKVPPLMVVTPE